MSIKSSGKNATVKQNQYIADTYDRINLLVPRGQKEVIKAHAVARDESMNAFINRAVTETMERDK